MSVNIPHPAAHGEYVAGQGFYDKAARVWRTDPSRLTQIVGDETTVDSGHAADFARWSRREQFQSIPELDRIRQLRDSDRPEERARAEQLLAGRRRTQLSDYENRMAAHVAGGGELPEGVTAPKGES